MMADRACTCRLRLHNRSSLVVWQPFSMLISKRSECFKRGQEVFGHRSWAESSCHVERSMQHEFRGEYGAYGEP